MLPDKFRFSKNSVLLKTFLFLGSYGFLLILTIVGAVNFIASNLEEIYQSHREFDRLSNEVEIANEYFIRQAKDRKNLFLRGHNQQDLDKYLLRVESMTDKIQLKIAEIIDNPLSKKYQPDLELFLTEHNSLMTNYYEGIEIFRTTKDHTIADQFVRGNGSKVGSQLTKVIQDIKQDKQELLAKNRQNIKQFLIITTSGLLLIILAYSSILILVVTNPIHRIVRFTNFLEESSKGHQSNINIDIHHNRSSLKHEQVDLSLNRNKNDEIDYMINTYSKLYDLISSYSQTLEEKVLELSEARKLAEVANHAKSKFLTTMSHQLRTPLNAILGFTQLMQYDTAISQSQSEYLEIINRNGEHLLALINDVLDLSKIEAGKIELNSHEFDLFKLLDNTRETLELYAQTKGLKLLFVCHPDTPQYIKTDEQKLRQVLINLLNNAIKFTLEGTITVRVQPDNCDRYRLIFEVEDTGVGITPEELGNLFKPFIQTHTGRKSYQGSGLGLAISHKLVELMNGELRVHTQVGIGSTFSFEVQAEPVNNSLPNQTVIREIVGLAANQPRYRILVADDHQDHLQVVCQLLKSIGFEVKAAENGHKAIAIWQDWQPHLIFMDLQMPLVDGYQATKIVKSEHRTPKTIIIALSANVFDSKNLEQSSLNCDDFIYKPFRLVDLLRKIENHLQVQYIYQELPEKNYSDLMPSNLAVTELDIANLELISSQWLIEIHQAALIADCQIVQQLIAEIDLEHEAIAKSLSNCLDEFRFDQIAQLAAEVLLNRQ